MRDCDLIEKLKTDPDSGMRKLIDLYSGLVYSVVKGALSDSLSCDADIENCTADAFSDFYLGLERYDPTQSSIKSFLCVIAKRRAVDYLRSYGKCRTNIPLEDADAALDFSFDEEIDRAELIREIKKLGTPDSEIIIRKFYLSQPSKEIAEKLGMTVSAVDTRTHRALKKLREILGGERG